MGSDARVNFNSLMERPTTNEHRRMQAFRQGSPTRPLNIVTR